MRKQSGRRQGSKSRVQRGRAWQEARVATEKVPRGFRGVGVRRRESCQDKPVKPASCRREIERRGRVHD
ncbi:hypothetical protein E2C01_045963 [Portunus trituberculatus]|uniref:Uncharacterized protein n=1 Tax=Portunus trituberculatus TaxID=210409 RepID=A0A5B7G6D0_PORTR|nr:hypothetical protein [Portunus trituberculatus]